MDTVHVVGLVFCGIGATLGLIGVLMAMANSTATLFEYRDYEPKHKVAYFLMPGFGTFFNKTKDLRQQRLMNRRARLMSICVLIAPIFGIVGVILFYVEA